MARQAVQAQESAFEVVKVISKLPKQRRRLQQRAVSSAHKTRQLKQKASTTSRTSGRGSRRDRVGQSSTRRQHVRRVAASENNSSDRGEDSANQVGGSSDEHDVSILRRRRAGNEFNDSGSETEREQEERRRSSTQRRLNQELVIGRTVPLARPAQTPRTPSPQRYPLPIDGCTPYLPVYNPAKRDQTLETGYSPTSRKVVQALKWPLKVFAATQRGFFTEMEANEHMEPLLLAQLQHGAAGQKNRIARKADGVYITNILKHIRETGSKLRSHLIREARIVVRTHYELLSRKPPSAAEDDDQRSLRVREMLHDYKFAGANPDIGSGMFQHPAIHALISAAFFSSSAPTFNIGADERYVDTFQSYPDGLIVLAATAVYAALTEWTSGAFKAAKFEGRKYEDAYDYMHGLLKDITAGTDEREEFTRKRADWYTAAWATTGLLRVAQDETTRHAIVMRNRAELRAERAQARNTSTGQDSLSPPASPGGAPPASA